MTVFPPTWCATTVAAISDPLRYGYTASANPEADGPKMLRITDIQDGQVQWLGVPRCEIAPDKRDKFLVSPGDIVFARTGGTVGKSFLIRQVPEPAVFASYLIKVAPATGVEPRYLYWFFQSLSYWDQIALEKGGLQGNVNAKTLGSIELPFAPTNEQQRIVERIEVLFDEIDRGVESLRAAKRAIALYRESLLKSAFEGRLTADWRAKNPDKLESPEVLVARIREERQECYKAALHDWELALSGWHAKGAKGIKPAKPKKPTKIAVLDDREMKELPPVPDAWGFNRLGLYIGWIQAGKSFKCLESEPTIDQVGVAKVSAVTWGEYDEAESKTCLNENKVNEGFFIREGDFLLSRANTIELVGASVIVQKVTKKIMLSDKTLRIHFAAKDRRFFLHYLRSPYGRAEIQARSTGNQASMRNIGQDRVNSIILPICSPAEQAEIVRILDGRLEAVDTLQAEIDTNLARAEALRQSILKRAFSGQLVPQDPTDEPASALLARIRGERDTKPPKRSRRRSEA